jgi:hypothetical protein
MEVHHEAISEAIDSMQKNKYISATSEYESEVDKN